MWKVENFCSAAGGSRTAISSLSYRDVNLSGLFSFYAPPLLTLTFSSVRENTYKYPHHRMSLIRRYTDGVAFERLSAGTSPLRAVCRQIKPSTREGAFSR